MQGVQHCFVVQWIKVQMTNFTSHIHILYVESEELVCFIKHNHIQMSLK